ncbi:MAG: TIGR03435 family protein [Candidatus Solibacter sp.]
MKPTRPDKFDNLLIAMNLAPASLIALSTLAAQTAPAQTAPAQLKFEVASVKRADRCDFKTTIDPGFISLKGMPLKPILMEAFKVRMDQIEGPAWLETECFDIAARMPEGAAKDQLPALLQALLIQRFKLAARKETRTRPGYALLIDKDGPKFKESDSNFVRGRNNLFYIGRGPGYGAFKGSMTLATLARSLSTRLDGQVEDLTGLQGKFDIDLAWVPDPSIEQAQASASAQAANDPDREDRLRHLPNPPTTDIFHALRESLGLKLEPRKQQVDTILIDHIERIPTGN